MLFIALLIHESTIMHKIIMHWYKTKDWNVLMKLHRHGVCDLYSFHSKGKIKEEIKYPSLYTNPMGLNWYNIWVLCLQIVKSFFFFFSQRDIFEEGKVNCRLSKLLFQYSRDKVWWMIDLAYWLVLLKIIIYCLNK